MIIDTDGGIDDARAICMMLASPNVKVLAVTTSRGAQSAENAFLKVKSLLNSLYHNGIPVGINRYDGFLSPEFPSAKGFAWGDENTIDLSSASDYVEVIEDIITHEKSLITFVCLGGMTTLSDAVKEIPALNKRMKNIVWSCNGLEERKGFNNNLDRHEIFIIDKL